VTYLKKIGIATVHLKLRKIYLTDVDKKVAYAFDWDEKDEAPILRWRNQARKSPEIESDYQTAVAKPNRVYSFTEGSSARNEGQADQSAPGIDAVTCDETPALEDLEGARLNWDALPETAPI
jgi:hypothetical protein